VRRSRSSQALARTGKRSRKIQKKVETNSISPLASTKVEKKRTQNELNFEPKSAHRRQKRTGFRARGSARRGGSPTAAASHAVPKKTGGTKPGKTKDRLRNQPPLAPIDAGISSSPQAQPLQRRKNVAHGAGRGITAPPGAFLPIGHANSPRLSPWATFLRPPRRASEPDPACSSAHAPCLSLYEGGSTGLPASDEVGWDCKWGEQSQNVDENKEQGQKVAELQRGTGEARGPVMSRNTRHATGSSSDILPLHAIIG